MLFDFLNWTLYLDILRENTFYSFKPFCENCIFLTNSLNLLRKSKNDRTIRKKSLKMPKIAMLENAKIVWNAFLVIHVTTRSVLT